jgi:hypothetical protein
MRKGVLFGILIGLSFLAGCTSGVVKTGPERVNSFRHSADMDFRQIADDWDTLWMVDRQTRLTPWITR